MTQDTEDVVARLAAWSNDPDDEPPIVLMMAAKSAIQSLSDRIDVLEEALRKLDKLADEWEGEAWVSDIARAALHQEGISATE